MVDVRRMRSPIGDGFNLDAMAVGTVEEMQRAGGHVNVTASPRASASRPATRATSVCVPMRQLSSESAPRYSTPDTSPSKPAPGVSTTSSGRTPTVDSDSDSEAMTGPLVPAMTAPPAPCSRRSRFIGGVPMKRATNVFAGAS